jgi:uncharacterized membrane protein YbaN (DUF454 family)
LFRVLGVLLLGIAILGALLPGLPTTIWVLMAGYCFSRSSQSWQQWLWQSRWFGPLLRDWQIHGGMRVRSKLIALTGIALACSASITWADVPGGVRLLIAVTGLTGIVIVRWCVKTVSVT